MDISDRKKYIRRGQLVTWCEHCGDFVDIPLEYDGRCPRCGEITLKRRCVRCGYEWWPYDPSCFATACPACKSPYYNRRRSAKYSRATARPRSRGQVQAPQGGTIEGLEARK